MKISESRLQIRYFAAQESSVFAKHLKQLVGYLASRLGIEVETGDLDLQDVMRLQLDIGTKQATVDIALKDQNGHLFSEFTLQAMSGIAQIHGRREDKPTLLGVNYVTTMTAINAFTLLLAQQVSLQKGEGQALSKGYCSPLAFALLGASQYIADAAHETPWQESGYAYPVQHPPFRSKDGVLFELEALDAAPWRSLWQRFGLAPNFVAASWKAFQLRYAKAVSPLPKVMYEFIERMSFDDINECCAQCGVAITRINLCSDQANKPLVKAVFDQGPWHFLNVSVNSTKEKNRNSKTAGCDDKSNNQLLPLSGVTLVESCRRIQGPLAGHLLGLLGAKIIRIEPPGGDPLRGMLPTVNGCSARFDAINRLKQVVEIDIKSTAGKQQIYELVAEADGFFHNWAPGKAEQLALDAKTLAACNPKLVYTYAGGWSESLAASLQAGHEASEVKAYSGLSLPGTDFVVQAASGVAAHIGVNAPSSKKSGFTGGSLFTVLDTLGGALAAQGMVIGLLTGERDGIGGYIETSLLGAASLLQNEALSLHYRRDFSVAIKHCADIFATATRPIVVSLPQLDPHSNLEACLRQKCPHVFGLDANNNGPQGLADIFKQRPAEYWIDVLTDISVALVTTNLAAAHQEPALQPYLESYSHTVKSPWSFQ